MANHAKIQQHSTGTWLWAVRFVTPKEHNKYKTNVTTAGDSTSWSSCSCLETACRSASQEKKMLEASRTIKGPMAMWWSTWSRLWSRGHSWPGRFHHLVAWSQDLGSALCWHCPWQHRTGFESSQDLNISSTKPLMKSKLPSELKSSTTPPCR